MDYDIKRRGAGSAVWKGDFQSMRAVNIKLSLAENVKQFVNIASRVISDRSSFSSLPVTDIPL